MYLLLCHKDLGTHVLPRAVEIFKESMQFFRENCEPASMMSLVLPSNSSFLAERLAEIQAQFNGSCSCYLVWFVASTLHW